MREIEGIDQVVDRLRPYWKEIRSHFDAENERFKGLLALDHDIIGRVLKCHLVVEHYLERYLGESYEASQLREAKLSFYQKAILLPIGGNAAAFVRPGILKLNSIRNQFGHTLQPVLTFGDLGPIGEILQVTSAGKTFEEPIDAVEAFTTVACTWLIVSPPHLQAAFQEAFRNVRVREP